MANTYDIQKHFKGLRVETGRRRRARDPLATGFEDDSDDDPTPTTARKSKSVSSALPTAPKSAPPVGKPVTPSVPNIAKTSALSATDKLVDSDDDWLVPAKRTDRHPSPAPASLPRSSVSSGAGRRGSLDTGLQGQGLQTNRTARSARAQAAGTLAYLDDSDDEEESAPRPSRIDRSASPASFKKVDSVDPQRRASTPKGSREAPSEQPPPAVAVVPSRHTVASPFAGTKYLEDSDSDDEAVTSRSNSTDDTAAQLAAAAGSPQKDRLEVERVDKPKVQHGGGVSWRAFSASRTEQRNTEIEALQATLRQRGKSISFGTHALTDDGKRVPLAPQQFAALAGAGAGAGAAAAAPGSKRGRTRGKSPPRRAEDTAATEDEVADGGPVGVYDPKQYKTNPFTGESSSS